MSRSRSLTPIDDTYDFERKALAEMDAALVECAATTDGFLAAGFRVDAVYAKRMKFRRRMIDAPAVCRMIMLGSVGADCVDVAHATSRSIAVTHCRDSSTEPATDRAMKLLLAPHQRAIAQHRMVREGRRFVPSGAAHDDRQSGH